MISIYHAPVPWHFVVVGGSVSDTYLSHSFLNSFSLLIHTSQSLKLSIPRCCHCNEPAFAPYDQYPYSLYSFQYIFLGTEKENLFSNQRFLACWSFLLFSCVRCGGEHGLVVRALDLQAGGPRFGSSFLPLDGFVFGGPELNSCTLCK